MHLFTYLASVWQPDRSRGDWLRRHALYWVVVYPLIALSWVYWSPSAGQAWLCALMSCLVRYGPTTYLFLYYVIPCFIQERYRTAVGRLLIWLSATFGWRLGLQLALPPSWLHYLNGTNLADRTLTEASLSHLFDPSFMGTNTLVIMAASLKLFRYQYHKELANQQLAQQTLAVELQLLKAQVQPHFLFNTLNNIYALALQRSPRAIHTVEKLIALLEGLFQESLRSDVRLDEEIALLRNYVALEEVRYGHRLRVSWQVEGPLADQRIAPLLLLPFVENAFKHGAAEQTELAQIQVHIQVSSAQLRFQLRNTVSQAGRGASAGPGGLGLQNVRKRLALLYPNQHSLRAGQQANWYTVDLQVTLGLPSDASPDDSPLVIHRGATVSPSLFS